MRASAFVLIGGVALTACASKVDEAPVEPSRMPLIYGTDNRRELYETTDPVLRYVAASTAIVVEASTLRPSPGGGFDLDGFRYGSFGQWASLCAGEPYADQPVPGLCSAYVVGEDVLATAGHCVETHKECASLAFVFGFSMIDEQTPVDHIDADDVYRCRRAVPATVDDVEDWALVTVDRPIVGRSPLPLRRDGDVALDPAVHGLVLVGHPVGLPLKITGGDGEPTTTGVTGAEVRRTTEHSFEADFDAYEGSSGSGVVSLTEAGALHFVEGTLIGGNEDFVHDAAGDCYRSAQCSASRGCTGSLGSGWEVIDSAHNVAPYVQASCGDTICMLGESCLSCDSDCGSCGSAVVSFSDSFSSRNAFRVAPAFRLGAPSDVASHPSIAAEESVLSSGACAEGCSVRYAMTHDLRGLRGAELVLSVYFAPSANSSSSLSLRAYNGHTWIQHALWLGADSGGGWRRERVDLAAYLGVADFDFELVATVPLAERRIEIDDVELLTYSGAVSTDAGAPRDAASDGAPDGDAQEPPPVDAGAVAPDEAGGSDAAIPESGSNPKDVEPRPSTHHGGCGCHVRATDHPHPVAVLLALAGALWFRRRPFR